MRALIVATLFALAACSSRLDLALAPETSITIRQGAIMKQVEPGTETYQDFQDWLMRNQTGWSQSHATNPNGGVFVSDGHIAIQFSGGGAFIHRGGRLWTKDVKKSDYQFLLKAPGT